MYHKKGDSANMIEQNSKSNHIFVFEFDRMETDGRFLYITPLGYNKTLVFSPFSLGKIIKTIIKHNLTKEVSLWVNDNETP